MTFGVTVLPEWVQCEGIDPLLDRLQQAGVTDIATSPYVMEPSDTGTREPPADAGAGKVRQLDRELWGQRELTVRTAPSFTPDSSLYTDTGYQPPTPDNLTEREGKTVARFIQAAKARNIKVWFQVQAAIPPGYRVQFGGPSDNDAALGPDDDPGPARVDKNGSLAAPDILAYGQAMMRDLASAYPDIHGIRLDWPEYPPYAFHSLFFDFSSHALQVASEMGIDIARLRADTVSLRTLLISGLSATQLSKACYLDQNVMQRVLEDYAGVIDLVRLRRQLSINMITQFRSALPSEMALVPQAFPPPFNLLSGFDYSAIGELVQGIGVKVYTMHWPMILSNWGVAMSRNAVNERALASALVEVLALGQSAPETIDGFHYPEPEEPHPTSSEAIIQKIQLAKAASGSCPVYAFTHAYGPVEDVLRRASASWEASAGKMWVNRYGYLSNKKLTALGSLVRSSHS